jgi:hopanoid biosynthesis associated protein HpnK
LRGLIVTADDFGAAIEVNEAVDIAHREGVLTAASLMVAGPAASDAVARARRMASLRVGLHLVLVEGTPALPPSDIPDLVDEEGLLRTDMGRFGAAVFLRRSVRRQLTDEITAQFEAFRQTGLPLDHVTVHKHFHLHPTVADLVLAIGKAYGARAVRVPVEPQRVLARAEPGARGASALSLSPWVALLGRKVRTAGAFSARQTFGLAWSGAMTGARVASLVRDLPLGVSEIYLHPAVRGGFARACPTYRYADELAGLIDPALRDGIERSGARLGGFADFAPANA